MIFVITTLQEINVPITIHKDTATQESMKNGI